ncbi:MULTISPECIES: diphosphomevalonate/mevalonate 3,5-bisphosphate decarboxylase family protein [unclassified Aureispira]|uniref:diphosphomevalonate/mevalonate 3,5-bisphosphate decarboxylase family protein n=1 Tax=unclassified Aureispira TaxID=2649989 RepID=UPI0006988BB8|nr:MULTISPECIES: diphosphomevalonate decarboxylase [unclassified Aureispira]WMX14930.1 diphosphomevalonate decarboxylase [Aureispira sp. CCB-E]
MKITWRSPSNLALIKYWGKYGRQLPKNASISFTLQNAYSETSLSYTPKEDNGKIELDFLFEGKENEAFKNKIVRFLESITEYFPFLTAYKLHLESHNSFPHSAGIASSASSMSALALCLCSMEREVSITMPNEELFFRKASDIARLGSGSASRSVYPYLALWGVTDLAENSSNEYAIPFAKQVHEVFHSFHDDILMVSKKEKSVSSTAGHALMEGNPFAEIRYQQAHRNLEKLLVALKEGDLATFGTITEQEALQLHALMMTSEPSYILMEGNSIELIKRVQAWRKTTGNHLYFSLDAGPNLHLLYPDSIKNAVQEFIESDLLDFCEGRQYLKDQVGKGPIKLS